MFEQFFGLSENPFSLTPDPRFIFASRCHDEALAHLKYWLEHKEGFALVTGEVGTGKTTALFRLIDGLERRYEIAFITNSTLSPVDLLEEICRKFGLDIETGTSKPALLQKLETYLKRQVDRGSGSLLIIDEAQNFEQPLLEEVRLLSNIARPGGPPMLQIALIGQPELERKLSLPELRQLKQRIGVHYRIEPLSADETLKYVHHRVSVAGGYPRVLFPEETVNLLFQKTFGLPREINQVGSQALLGAYVEDSTTVRPEHIQGAIKEMSFKSVLAGTEAVPAPRAVPIPAVMPVPVAMPVPAVMPVPPVIPAPRPMVVDARPMPARIDPISVEPVTTPRSVEAGPRSPTPASVPNFISLPPLSTPRVEAPPNEGRVRLARIGLVVGAVTILGVAGFLLFMPQKTPRDELADIENETM
ncbi:MAG: AAA family ATPase, partial [Candidatus Eisenbacteria bacterium]|nr:AAA family ATPase [Candidatus Eisenbacteria bacterium]